MLPVYNEGTDVVVTQTLPLKNGSPVAATSVQYAVFDEAGSIILARQAVPGWTSGNVTLEVPLATNTLPVNKNRSLRIVEFYFVTAADGEFKERQRYIIQNFKVLEFLTNSFQTLDQAYLTAMEIPDIDGWNAAEDNDKIAAMITAHQAVCRLAFRFYKDEDQAQLEYTYKASPGEYIYVPRMRLIKLSDWNQFPARFQNALRRAQVIEADINLAGDPIRDKRMDGIVSETIGESKMFFNNRPPISLPVARRTLEALAGYFYYNNRITRTG
jgi:hypothetical protein